MIAKKGLLVKWKPIYKDEYNNIGDIVNYLMLVNKDNLVDRTYIPDDLVNSNSMYRDNILVNKKVLKMFNLMKKEASKLNYNIDIMSGYRDYYYQEKIYNKLVKEMGLNYAFRYIAMPGASEHQTGLAIDICIYRSDKAYVEKQLTDFEEIAWLEQNAHRFGFILRYPKDMEDVTGYNYEPWHFRYVGNKASYLYYNDLVLEEYLL